MSTSNFMLLKRFNFQVIIRILLLLLTLGAFAFIFGRKELLFNHIILVGIIGLQVYELIRFVAKTNHELSRFLLAVQYADYSVNYQNNGLGASFEALNEAFFTVAATIKEAKIQKEAQYQFLRMMVDKISAGIISLKEDNEVYLINKEARALLGLEGLRHWDDLESMHPDLVTGVKKAGDYGKQLVSLPNGSQLSVAVSSMLLIDQRYKLLIFQDIEREMEQKEIEAWNKLIRILTHEIMNSVTPIASLTDSLLRLLHDRNDRKNNHKPVDKDDIDDIIFSLQTIQRRSDGMLRFVDDYRKLTKIPQPKPETIRVKDLLERIVRLMQGEGGKKGIQFHLAYTSPTQSIEADEKLIEQVLINLLTNSIHALENKPAGTIEIRGFQEGHQNKIEIKDNGHGIDEDKLGSIFVPFYSTKPHGSGIGLSLSKQIMHLHQGSIKVASRADGGTSFTLVFNN